MILLPSVSTWLENITALGSEALVENDDVQIDRFCVFSSFVLAGLIVLFSWRGGGLMKTLVFCLYLSIILLVLGRIGLVFFISHHVNWIHF